MTKKLFEEAGEFAENHDPSELYDLHDVLKELLSLMDPDGVYVKKHCDKVLAMGTFSSHLEWSPVPDG